MHIPVSYTHLDVYKRQRMSEQLTDQVLVERVQKGDQKAFNLLVVRYQHKVASLVSRLSLIHI